MAQRPFAAHPQWTIVAALCLAPGALAQSPLYTKSGDKANDRLGVSVASAGDVNNDGENDFIVGAPEDGDVFTVGEGYARVFSGASGGVLYTVHGAMNVESFGVSVDGAGLVNNDARADFVVGAPRAQGAIGALAGKVRVYSGLTGTLLYTFEGLVASEQLGVAVSGAGDVNNDGFDDVIAGAPLAPAGGTERGLVRIYSGANGSVLRTLLGTNNNGRFGTAVDAAGDLNNDGFDDVIVGSVLAGARVFSGQTGLVMYTFSAPSDDRLGTSVAGVGDVSGDNVPDLLVGAPQDGGFFGPGPGYARLFSGSNGAVLHTFPGLMPGDRFGLSVSGAGDANCDARRELLIGADQKLSGGDGYAEVYDGASLNLLQGLTAATSNERFGTSVAGLGDANGDGFIDLLVGAPANSSAFLQAGQARVYGALQGCGGCPLPVIFCQSSINSTGAPALISSSGTTSIAANDFVLNTSGAPPSTLGRYFYGLNQAAPGTPFGNGFRCVGDPFVRLPAFNAQGDGTAPFALDYNALLPPGLITAGSVWNFQYWYRNPAAGGANFNASNGLSATFCP